MPLNQRGEVGEIDELQAVRDADGDSARPASDERIESVREQGENGAMNQMVYETSGTGTEQVDAAAVPDGHGVAIQGHYDNVDTVYIGDAGTQAHALGTRESLVVDVENTDEIHVQTPTAGDKIVLTWVTL